MINSNAKQIAVKNLIKLSDIICLTNRYIVDCIFLILINRQGGCRAMDLYRKLQQQLDTYSVGFPATESGIEIEILKELFNEEDAQLFTCMSPMLETSDSIAQRLGKDVQEIVDQLERMALNGLLFRLNKDGVKKYGTIPFIHGLFEFQVKRLTKEKAAAVEKYFKDGLHKTMADTKGLFLRTIPVQESIEIEHRISSFDDSCKILAKAKIIVVADCICRKGQQLIDKGCGKILEACFMFGSMARYYIDNNLGRQIDYDEAVRILKKAQEAGLVTQPATTQNPTGMCNCCGDCCGVLRSIKLQPKPAELVFSNHRAIVNKENCTGCEICIERCEMDAISMDEEEIAVINYDRCIGCGLCVTTCSFDAMSLEKRPEKYTPPENAMQQMMTLAKERGVLS
jgi:H+/Na+-translocating ferredoxin:NAD+ oxidoreductase subunit B